MSTRAAPTSSCGTDGGSAARAGMAPAARAASARKATTTRVRTVLCSPAIADFLPLSGKKSAKAWSAHREPAVDGDDLAGDVAGFVRQEEDDGRGHFFGRALAAERHRRLRPVGAARSRQPAERGVDQARGDDVGT